MIVKYLNLEFWFYQIYILFRSVYEYIIYGTEAGVWRLVSWIILTLALFFLILLSYSVYKLLKLRKKEETDFMAGFAAATDPKVEKSEEWQDILDHADSENESQWKLALIDADKILENLLRENGFGGEGVGEALKMAELQGGLKSLQDAWEAHKIRNRIAHEVGFALTKRETRRAVELYKKVFEELGFL